MALRGAARLLFCSYPEDKSEKIKALRGMVRFVATGCSARLLFCSYPEDKSNMKSAAMRDHSLH
jgi:hypothetical protein